MSVSPCNSQPWMEAGRRDCWALLESHLASPVLRLPGEWQATLTLGYSPRTELQIFWGRSCSILDNFCLFIFCQVEVSRKGIWEVSWSELLLVYSACLWLFSFWVHDFMHARHVLCPLLVMVVVIASPLMTFWHDSLSCKLCTKPATSKAKTE